MKTTQKRYYKTTCHIVSFSPPEFRMEPHNGIQHKRESIHSMWGAPELSEVTSFKATGPFFNVSDIKSEMIGESRGDAFLNIAWDGEKLYLEPDIPSGLQEVSTSYALVRDGEESTNNEQYFSSILGSNPRMIIGQKASGEVVFIAADGRKWNEKGLTSEEQREVCMSEGLKLAVNNDGGGSVALIVEDKLLNKNYDGRPLGYIWCGYRKWNKEELPLLEKGKKGMWVNLLQRYLTAWGFVTTPDGVFGPKTKESVVDFQINQNLTVDGIVGPQTWGKLITLIEKKPVISLPDNLLAIDPGHGGENLGGGSMFGYREKDLNLVESLRIAEILEDYDPFLTRESDKFISLKARGDAIKKGKYKFCLSIHHNNSGTDTKNTGCLIFISIYASEAAKKLAEYIGKEMEKVGIEYKGTRTRTTSSGGDYYGMHQFTGTTETLIIEPLYMDNPDELQKLNVEKIAQAYALGFKEFIEEYYINTLS